MELWQELLCGILQEQIMEIRFPKAPNLNKLFESECYKALCAIRNILKDRSLDDEGCFMKIEEIVRTFERMGCTCGSRHDF